MIFKGLEYICLYDNAFKHTRLDYEMGNYEQLLQRIAGASGILADEVERKIEAKRAKLSGLISKEGAAQIVAAELGVSLDNELLKLAELVEGMKRAHVLGKVTHIFPVRTYSKNGKEGKIGSFLLGDASSNVRVVLWDTHHIDLLESGGVKEGDVIDIMNASVRNGEVHLSAFADLKQSSEKLGDVEISRVGTFGLLKDARVGMYSKIRATIVQLFEPKYFDDKHDGKKRALVNFVLDDGTETMRAVMGVENLLALGLSEEEIFSIEAFNQKKPLLLGEEKFFVGAFRQNTYFNRLEMNLERIEEVNVDTLVKELEAA